jgi:hypothetical protein
VTETAGVPVLLEVGVIDGVLVKVGVILGVTTTKGIDSVLSYKNTATPLTGLLK